MVLFRITRKRAIVFSAGMLLLLLLFAFAGGPAIVDGRFPMIHSAEDPDAVPIADAKELLTEFENDAKATLKRYGGRIWLRGMVTEISGPEVTLEGPPGVRCVYVSVNDQTAMQVKNHSGSLCHDRRNVVRPWNGTT